MDNDEFEKLLSLLSSRPDSPFSGAIEAFLKEQETVQIPALELASNITDIVCPNGSPVKRLGNKPLDWHRGIGAFCDPDARGVFGSIAAHHSDAKTELYRVWENLEGSEFVEPMYLEASEPIGNPKQRGAFLVPALDIPNRERLSNHFINSVLRPYAQAEIALRKYFYKAIQGAHDAQQWIGFRPLENGRFVEILPTLGFDGSGGYSIDRATYLKGFNYSESEVGKENFRNREPIVDQDNWLFLDVDQSILNINEASSSLDSKSGTKVGRPKGTGFAKQDQPFVDQGLQLISEGLATSSNDAALQLLSKCEDLILGSSFDAKVTRLRKSISKAAKTGLS